MLGIVVLICIFIVGFVLLRTIPGSTYRICTGPIVQEKVIFIYQPGCPYCEVAKPVMEKREDIYWLDLAIPQCVERLRELNLVESIRGTPTFVCTKNISVLLEGVPRGDTETLLNQWIEKNC